MAILDELIVKIGPEFVNLDRLRAFENRMDRFKQRVDRAAGTLLRLGAAGTAAAAGPLVAFARYEENLAKIEGLVGVNREQLDAWHDDIAAIAVAVGIGPEKLTDALYDITSAGLRGEIAMQVLEASAKAAAAGLGDQKSIADLATSAINAYGADNLSAAEAVDHLTEAVRLGKLAPESLAAAMGRALPIASAMGVQFNEVAGILAAMSRTGTNAEEGVTQLNAVMAGLLKPAESAHKALGRVGLSIEGLRDMASGPQGLWGVLRELKTAFGDNIEAMAEVFPNVRALRGVFDLLGPGLVENDKLLREIKDSTGVTDEAFQAMAQTLIHQWRRAMATFKVALVQVGMEMADTAKAVVDFVQRMIGAFTEMPETVKAMVAQLLTIGPALLAAGAALKVLAIGLGVFTPLITTVTTLATAIRAIGPAFLSVTALNPWLLGLTAAAVALIAAWEPVSTFFAGLADTFRDAFGTGEADEFSEGVIEAPGRLTAAFNRLIEQLGPIGDAITGTIKRMGDAWNWLIGLFSDADGTNVGASFGSVLIDVIAEVINWIADLVANWNAMVAVVTSPIDTVKKAWDWIFPPDDVPQKVERGLEPIDEFMPHSDAQRGPFSRLTSAGKAIIDTMADGMRQALPLGESIADLAFNLPGVDRQTAILDFIAGDLPVAPYPAQHLTAGSVDTANQGGGTTIQMTFGQGAIQIDAPGGDVREIADGISERLGESMRALTEQSDSKVLA